MAGPLSCKRDAQGAYVVVEQEPLCSGCLTNEEVDAEIDRLEADLERLRPVMKVAARMARWKKLGMDLFPHV